MALLVLATAVEASAGTSISITDTTGAFNTNTRPGGYGAGQAPNNKRDYTDILYSFIRVTPPGGEDSDEVFIYVAQSDAQALANPGAGNTPYSVSNTVLQGNSNTIVDGVYPFIYYPCFDTMENVQNFGFTNGSNTITIAQDDLGFTNLSYILVPGDGSVTANADNHYRVDAIDVDALTITLDREYTGVTGTISSAALVFGYATTAYGNAIYNINACLHSKIAQISTSNCSCRKTKINNLTEALTLFFSQSANIDCANYEKAQDLIDYLSDYCGSSSQGGCGC